MSPTASESPEVRQRNICMLPRTAWTRTSVGEMLLACRSVTLSGAASFDPGEHCLLWLLASACCACDPLFSLASRPTFCHALPCADDVLNFVPLSYTWECTAADGLSPCFNDDAYLPKAEGASYTFDPSKVAGRAADHAQFLHVASR
jgi:hypothetical protein